MLSPEQKVRLDNFDAQYSSILGNIQNANTELKNVLNKIEDAENVVLSLGGKIEGLKLEVKELTAKKIVAINATNNSLKELEKKESEVALKEKSATQAVVNLDKQKNSLTADIHELEVLKAKLLREYVNSSEDVSTIKSILSALTVEFRELSNEKSALETELAVSLKSLYDAKEELQKEIKELSSTREIVINQIEESKARVLDASVYVNDKEAEIARRESDVKILTRRLERIFGEVRPDLKVTI